MWYKLFGTGGTGSGSGSGSDNLIIVDGTPTGTGDATKLYFDRLGSGFYTWSDTNQAFSAMSTTSDVGGTYLTPEQVTAVQNLTTNGVPKVQTINTTIAAGGNFTTALAGDKQVNIWKILSQTFTPSANIATDGTKALVSSNTTTNVPANAFDVDGGTPTYWQPFNTVSPVNEFLGYDFTTPKDIIQITYIPHTNAYNPKNVKVQWSDDNISWSDAYATLMPSGTAGVVYTISFSSAGAHRYWRLYITDSYTGCRIRTLTMSEGTVVTNKQIIKDADSITATHDGATLTLANAGASSVNVRVLIVG